MQVQCLTGAELETLLVALIYSPLPIQLNTASVLSIDVAILATLNNISRRQPRSFACELIPFWALSW